jgi:hypothetical protein
MADHTKIEWTDVSWNPIRAVGHDARYRCLYPSRRGSSISAHSHAARHYDEVRAYGTGTAPESKNLRSGEPYGENN